MSELGPAELRQKEEQNFLGREIAQHRDYSEVTSIRIDSEVRKIVTEQYERATKIIGVQTRRIVSGLPLDDAESPSTASDVEQPQLKEPVQRPLKPILPPITGSTAATA